MGSEHADLDQLQSAYKAAVEAWITAIRAEEELASVPHTVAEIDTWEHAHFLAEEAGTKAAAAKADYESALRSRFYGFD